MTSPVVRVALLVPLLLVCCREPVEVPEPSLEGMEPQVAKAIDVARAAVLENPRSGASWGKLGLVLEAHGLPDEARACYRRAVELSVDDYRWLYYQAALERNVDPGPALELLSRAEEFSPRSLPVLLLKASIEEQLDAPEAARNTYRKMLEVDPELAVAEFALGRLDLAAGALEDAESHLERAAALQPEAGAIHAALARLYTLQGDREAAMAASARAESLEPEVAFDNPEARAVRNEEVSTRGLQRRAQEAEARGEIALAEELHARLLALHPDEAELHYNAGNFFARGGRLDEAARRYRRALELDGEHAETTLNLGNLLAETGQLDEAEALLRRAVALEPDDPAALVGLSNALAQKGELGEAAPLLERVLEADPDHLPALQGLAQIRAAEGRFEEAMRLFSRALEAHPDDGRTHFLVALQLARRGDYLRAWRHVKEAERRGFTVPEDFVDALRMSYPEPSGEPSVRARPEP